MNSSFALGLSTRNKVTAVVLALLVVIGVAGVGIVLPGAPAAEKAPPLVSVSPPPTASVHAHPDVSLCGSFAAIEYVADSVRRDPLESPPESGVDLPRDGDHPAVAERPAAPTSTRPATDFIGLANGLSNSPGRDGSSPALNSAIASYIQSLAHLGAAINHAEPPETVDALWDLSEFTAATVRAICRSA